MQFHIVLNLSHVVQYLFAYAKRLINTQCTTLQAVHTCKTQTVSNLGNQFNTF